MHCWDKILGAIEIDVTKETKRESVLVKGKTVLMGIIITRGRLSLERNLRVEHCRRSPEKGFC